MTAVIEVRGLVKRYAEVTAVDGLSLDIGAGEVYGLLGENGAGKSTTIEILEGHRHATSGEVSVLGVDPRRADGAFYDRIGIVLQSSGIERVLTVREVLTMYAPSYARPRSLDECVELVGLGAFVDQRIEKLSGGQRRRVDLALGIIGHPELLFLDEPTTGLDPAARRASWELIRALSAEGTTIILTSHYLDEVEQLAESRRRDGARPPRGRGDARHAGGGGRRHGGALCAARRRRSRRAAVPRRRARQSTARQVTVSTPTPTATLHALTGWALERGHDLAGLTVSRPTLEDMFLEVTAGAEAGDA